MSYDIGTDLARLREMIGDTDPDELFHDDYLNDLLSQHNSINQAAVTALRRVIVDPTLMRKKFKATGFQGLNNMGNYVRILEELIRHLQESEIQIVTATGDDSCFPDTDKVEIGRATDEDGWPKRGTINTYLDELGDRR